MTPRAPERSHPAWLRFLPRGLRQRLADRNTLIAVIDNSGWLLLDRLLRLLLGLLVGAWVARYLGPAQYGELAYVLAYLAFFQAVASLGLDAIVVRDIARDPQQAGQILGTAFALRLATGTLCWLAAIVSVGATNGWNDRSVLLIALAGALLVFQTADTVDLWFQSQSQSRRTVLAKLSACIIANGVKVVLILQHAPLAAFAAVWAMEAGLAVLGLYVAYRRFPVDRAWSKSTSLAKSLLRESWPFMLSGLSVTVYMRIDQLMIKEMVGPAALGLYAAMLPLSALWHIIPMMLAISVAPHLARLRAQDRERYEEGMLRYFRLMLVTGITVSIITSISARFVVELLFGASYREAGDLLAVHAFTNIAVFLGVAQGAWLANEHRSDLALKQTLIGAIVAVATNLALLPKLGVMGAVIAANLAYLASAVLSNAWFAPRILLMQLGLRPKNNSPSHA